MEKISLKTAFNISLFLVLINRSYSVDDLAKSSLINFIAKLSGDSAQVNAILAWNLTNDPCKDWKGVECDIRNTSIRKLFLDRHGLAGTFDAAILCNVQSVAETLTVLIMDGNNINGGITDEIANCRQLSRLNVSTNRLSGDLPSSLAMLSNLKGLDISNNHFTGALPNLSRISGLNIFLAQNNRLSGQLPKFDFSNLDVFNVSFNNFSGPILDGGNRFPADTFQGNPELCGNPLPKTCSAASDTNQKEGKSKGPSKDQVLMYSGYIILGVIIISAVLFMICKRSGTRQKIDAKTEIASLEEGTKMTSTVSSERKTSASKSRYSVASESGMVSVSLVVLTTPAVNKLKFDDLLGAPAELLGRGKHGSLYKVKLDNTASLVVKRINDLTISSNDFKRRMQAMDQVRHPNVLSALAYYCSKEEKLLVYEYQENGSLFKLLHGKSKSFDWGRRLNVASTICEALCFMHDELKHEGIAHGNLKSSNILLNENMEPCISEYGVMVTEQREDHENSFSFSNAHALGALSNPFKADVYSYGVVLLELLTGKLVQNDGLDLADWVHAVVKEEWTVEVFDRSLISKGDSEERMVNLLQIAIKCVGNSPPSMKQVAPMINTLKEEEEERSTLYEV